MSFKPFEADSDDEEINFGYSLPVSAEPVNYNNHLLVLLYDEDEVSMQQFLFAVPLAETIETN